MNWPKLALTNAQQAPAVLAAQASRLGASQVALISVHWMSGISTQSAIATPTMVRIVLPTELKRLARIHGITPCVRVGGGEGGTTSRCTKNTSVWDWMSLMLWPLHQPASSPRKRGSSSHP